jgi:hypothetical protein
MPSFLTRLLRRTPPPRPLYALLLQQQQAGIAIQAIGPDLPLPEAKRMLAEAYQQIEQQEQAARQQQGGQP